MIKTWKKWLGFVELYLSMEQWFHDSNPKEEVNNARPLIAKVLQILQDLFPRDGTGNEYNIPKMHAIILGASYNMDCGAWLIAA